MAATTDPSMLTATLPAPPAAAAAASLTVAEVYERHAAMVFRALRALGVPPASLDDAVQDVFLVVHRRLGEFEGRAALTTWLFAIARRVAADHRRRVPRGTQPLSAVVEVADAGADPARAAQTAEAARAVLAILDTLDAEQREVFVLMELEQLAAPAVAEIVGAPLNTVYSRLRLARARFEQALARRAAVRAREESP